MTIRMKRNWPGGFRPAEPGEELPKEWGRTEAELRKAYDEVLTFIKARLPDRAFVLLTAPKGMHEVHVDAVACGTNINERADCAALFLAMIDHWKEQGLLERGVDPIVPEGDPRFPPPAPMPEPREWPPGDTKTTLVEDLLALPQSEHRDQIVAMAREGVFHDFDADHDVPPKILLVDMLRRFGFPELAGKARDGGYDNDRPTTEQVEQMRAELGPEMFDAIMGDKGRAKA